MNLTKLFFVYLSRGGGENNAGDLAFPIEGAGFLSNVALQNSWISGAFSTHAPVLSTGALLDRFPGALDGCGLSVDAVSNSGARANRGCETGDWIRSLHLLRNTVTAIENGPAAKLNSCVDRRPLNSSWPPVNHPGNPRLI